MPIQYPLIQGKAVDFSSLEISFQVEGKKIPPLQGITGLDWGIQRSGNAVYGKGPKALRQTRGQVSNSASLTMYKEEWQAWKQAVGDGYGEIPINIVGTWLEATIESKVEIIGATITDESQSASQGGDPPEVSIELLPMDIIEDDVQFLKP